MTPPAAPPRPTRQVRYGGAVFLGVLVLVLLTAPFVDGVEGGEMIEPALVTVVMVTAVGAVGGRRRTILAAALLAVPVVAGRWVHHAHPGAVPETPYLVAAVVFAGFVAGHQVLFVFQTTRVDANVLCAGVAGYLLLGLVWAALYRLVWAAVPGSFAFAAGGPDLTGFEATYFSFTTLCTVGYGDIVPVSRPARMLAVFEATAGLFYVTVLIARLVALYSAPPARPG